MPAPYAQHRFAPSGGIPNSRLPLLFGKGMLPAAARDGAAACRLYERNGWGGTWVYHVYPFWHFHTRGHEVLGCVAGSARIALGGEGGIVADVEVGDVIVIPAGVGHKRLSSSSDFLVAGGYPPGQSGNILRPGDLDDAAIARDLALLPLPTTDPISGSAEGAPAIWSKDF